MPGLGFPPPPPPPLPLSPLSSSHCWGLNPRTSHMRNVLLVACRGKRPEEGRILAQFSSIVHCGEKSLMAGAEGSCHLASTEGHLPYENVAFTAKDGARPGLTQEGRFLVGEWDHQCPLCFAGLWPSVCCHSALDLSQLLCSWSLEATPSSHGHHTNLESHCIAASDLAGVTLKTKPEMRSGGWLGRLWTCMCMSGLREQGEGRDNSLGGLPVGGWGSIQAGSS